MFRRSLPVLVLFAVVASLQCRPASGGADDPMDREADEAFTRYLQIDTTNPPGNESAGARFLQQWLMREGIAAQLVGRDPARQSVYARLPSHSKEKALLLLSHIDVVPATTAEWTRPPFAAVHAGGYVWGRGALDMKSVAIAEAMAMIELKRRSAVLSRDVIFLATADEEAGGVRGCRELLETQPDLFRDVGFVLNEGGYNETAVDRVEFWGIEVQQKVPLWLRLHARGSAGHAAAPPDDGGSVARLVRALSAILAIPTPYRLGPDVERFFHDAGAGRRDERGEVMRNIESQIHSPRLEHVLAPGYRSLLHDTIALTHIAAGTTVNSIPANATADVDIRLLPDEKAEEMTAQVRAAAGENAEVEVLLAGTGAAPSSSDSELFRTLVRHFQKAAPGSRVAAVVGAGATDSRYFRERGIVAYGIAPFKVNYYDAGTAHGNDERIRLQFFLEGVRLMRAIVSDFCSSASGASPGAVRR